MKSRSLTLCSLTLVCPPFAQQAVAAAAAMPAHLEHDVLRNGEPVGQHVMDFKSSGDGLQAQISTNVVVKMAFITVYRFEHSSLERWSKGHLESLTSKTYDDGTEHPLSVAAEGNRLAVHANGKQSTMDLAIRPFKGKG
jgi:Family of unknown function (DUF6134)